MKPPHDRERNPAAETLLAILVDDAFDALVSATRDPAIRDAVSELLVALTKARNVG